jgi:hypothetical protein
MANAYLYLSNQFSYYINFKPTIFKFTFLTIVNSTTPLDVLTNNGLSEEVLSHLAFLH